jgi:hypothetical protein
MAKTELKTRKTAKLQKGRLRTQYLGQKPEGAGVSKAIGAPQGPPVTHGDEVMVLFREGYIRDYRNWFDDANISIAFSIKTGNNSYSYTFGTVKVELEAYLPIQNVILLPPTKIEDHFSIVVNMIQESALKVAQEKISQVLPVLNKVVTNVPAYGTVGSTAIGIMGDIINLAAAFSPDRTLISQGNTYIVDKVRYPDIIDNKRYPRSGLDYLRLGTFIFYEDGYSCENGKFYKEGSNNQGNPTRLVIDLIKPKQ